MMKKWANIITGSRIAFSIWMLFSAVRSPCFYALYLLCGLTDMVDGPIARKTKAADKLGARLDSIADFIFVGAALAKLLPVIDVPGWLWVWLSVIAFIRAVNIISGFMRMKRLVVEHTVMNKVTGVLLFIFPLTLSFAEWRYIAAAVCSAATFAAIQEGLLIRTKREIL